MVETDNSCAVCGSLVRLRIGGVPSYYCADCFTVYKDAIMAKAPWANYLINQEKGRRKRRNRLLARGVCFYTRPLETCRQLM